ncbi:hypothetical protein RRG08_012327 [Elysia crispata]|uniref:Secreted protein n=1 Tax=Elysia crispata TaxID=231223 RepID=A0AAE1EDK7_9GAST|nr:hypothetical protein RRG08_012327 [Elysia crispata]
MRRFALLDVCVLTVLAVVMVLVPDAAGQRNRPGEAPERVCRGGNRQRPIRGGICGSAIPNAVWETLNLAFYSIESTEAACLSSLHKTVSVEDAGARLV